MAAADTPSQRKIWLFLALVLAGLAGNYFNFPIFLNINFLFGSVATLLVLQQLGWSLGTAAAALIASYTYVLWNEPYAWVLFTAEAGVVGWLHTRRGQGLVLSDALYWLLVGMPLGYVFYRLVLGVTEDSAFIIIVKQSVNGIANALLARLLFTLWAARSGRHTIPYRDLVYNLLAAFTLGPMLLLLMLASQADFRNIDAAIRAGLRQDSLRMTRQLEGWISERLQIVNGLAQLGANLSAADMQGRLEQARNTDANILRIGQRDANSVVVAYAPLVDEQGQRNVGKRFPERPYIADIRRSRAPLLAEVVMSRIDQIQPIAIVLAPIFRGDEFRGYVNAVLNLVPVAGMVEQGVEGSGLRYALIDKNQRVIVSNLRDLPMMTPFARPPGELTPLEPGMAQWLPRLPPNTSISERWQSSTYVTETTLGRAGEWRLVLEQPVAPFQQKLYARYARALTLLLAIVLAALALGEWLSRRTLGVIAQLARMTHEFPQRLADGAPQVQWPRSWLLEARYLTENFRSMADTLAQQFAAVRQLATSLETQVAQRTAELQASQRQLGTLLDCTQIQVWVFDGHHYSYANRQWFDFTGLQPALPVPVSQWYGVMHPHDVPMAMQLLSTHWEEHHEFEHQVRLRRHDGQYRTFYCHVRPVFDEQGRFLHLQGANLDITARHEAEQRLRLAASVFTYAREGILITDAEANILEVNDTFCKITGYARDEALGRNPRFLQSGRHDAAFYGTMWQALREHGHWSGEVWNRRKNGDIYAELQTISVVHDERGAVQSYVSLFSDITALKNHELQLERVAHFDALTGLPNRTLLADRLRQAMAQALRRQQGLAVVFLDLDGFKDINDTHGHASGDAMLVALTTRLKHTMRDADTLARLGGDEFVAVLLDLPDLDAARPSLQRMLDALAQPVTLGTQNLRVSASLGVTFFPQNHETDADTLLRQADQAMYQAKLKGKNRFHAFDASLAV